MINQVRRGRDGSDGSKSQNYISLAGLQEKEILMMLSRWGLERIMIGRVYNCLSVSVTITINPLLSGGGEGGESRK